MTAPPLEGALAPDPSVRHRVEPLREIPGLRRRERTWKDEVRERVRDRRRQRVQGDLPLFDEEPEPDDLPVAEAAGETETDALAGSRLGVAGHVPAPRTLQLDEFEAPAPAAAFDAREPAADLPLQPPPAPPAPLRGRTRAAAAPFTVADEPEPAPSPAWDLGAPPARDLAPVERPAYVIERFQAAVVDVVLLAALAAVVVYFAGRVANVEFTRLLGAWPYLAAFVAFLALNYAAYFTGTTGQTLGKMLAGLRVVDAADGRIGFARALARAALGSVGAALLVGVIPMFLDPARRGLHDRLLGTRVVKH